MRYTLMHKECEVLKMELDEITGGILSIVRVMSPEHIPIGIAGSRTQVDRAALNYWWVGRSIPASRSGMRNVLERLNMSAPQLLLTKCYGLSLSDQYWVRPADLDMQWESINFFQNPFSEDVGDILFGEPVRSERVNLVSPDNTSDGCLKKRWKIIDGQRCLIKGGSAPFHQEPLNEVFASKLMEVLGIPHVNYWLLWDKGIPYSVCPDFITPDTELVSAHHISRIAEMQEGTTKYQHLLNCCRTLGIPNVQWSLDEMLTVDFLIANEDRHMNNFGALRNAETLEWIGMAPIFDCGTSLWHDHLFRWGGPEADVACKPFAEKHSEQIQLVQSFEHLNFGALNGIQTELEAILNSAPQFIDELRKQTLCEAFTERVRLLQGYYRTR